MLKKILNIIIVLIILAILVFAGIFAYDMLRKYQTTEDNEEIEDVIDEVSVYLDNYLESIEQDNNIENTTDTNNTTNTTNRTTSKTSGTTKKVAKQIQYKDYSIIGKIVIDKIKLSYPILNESTVVSLKRSITKQYGVNPNEKGNMVLAGHNYRNGTMFSNLKKLVVGDIVKIIDLSGTTVEYKIYEIYETTPNDSAHLTQDTSIRHLVLTTCTNDNQRRIIVKCKEV